MLLFREIMHSRAEIYFEKYLKRFVIGVSSYIFSDAI